MPNTSIHDGAHGVIPTPDSTQLGFISAFMTLSLWIVLEFHVQVFRVFKRYRSLYFWSLFTLAWGIVLHCVGYLLNWFAPGCPWWLYAVVSALGWSMLVTGESLVLYSRMHLVTRKRKILRFVLGMIIFTALFVQIPNWVTSIPAVDRDIPVSEVWTPRDSIETRIQLIAFLLQETIISSIYIWFTGRILKPSLRIHERRVMLDLVYVNAIIIIVDVVTISFAFTNYNVIKEILQNLSYALKLKLEFFVLNQLTSLSQDGLLTNPSSVRRRYIVRGETPQMKESDDCPYKRLSSVQGRPSVSPTANHNYRTSFAKPCPPETIRSSYDGMSRHQHSSFVPSTFSAVSTPLPTHSGSSTRDDICNPSKSPFAGNNGGNVCQLLASSLES